MNDCEKKTLFSLYAQFEEVNNGMIGTIQYLEASKGIVKFVEQLGTLFKPVRSDINGNIEKLTSIYNSNPNKYKTLNSIVEVESKSIADGEFKIGTDALLWLTRALQYIHLFLTYFYEDYSKQVKNEDLSVHFKKAYEETLKMHHNWFVQQIFYLCLNAAPDRTSLIKLISIDDNEDAVDEAMVFKEIEKNNQLLNANITAVRSLFQSFSVCF
ncbi:Glycolipid transfer protein-like protein [Leptotrombidium deliense]|uniref:Glycolipid transfer protein-like protein n=1 Tax=Leptotrombidium deliense TaxID=299467 RepID=A0A443SE37_9ACAR|nr:Glycolipid transfer protein-like protein [Leptotrombidium deliense]